MKEETIKKEIFLNRPRYGNYPENGVLPENAINDWMSFYMTEKKPAFITFQGIEIDWNHCNNQKGLWCVKLVYLLKYHQQVA